MNDLYALNYLGIDWGKRDVGIALAHAETRVAISFATEHNDPGLLDRLKSLITKEAIGTVVIGVPTHVNRTEIIYPGEIFGQALAKAADVQVVYQDEMFTTKRAQQSLIERGERHVSRKDDAEAARIILQEWLDRTA
ncbi:MAG: Holliday junction resolvase RuvX [Candidatus Moraniibacteriota bacterium]|nr:MAG: Holliday junction resolvase RuvX [Candidatus Moranbacteria bacterium]